MSRGASRFRVGLPIRVKTAILFVAIALLPAALVAGWLTRLYAAAVLTTERQLQTAVLEELAISAQTETEAVVSDLRAVADALALAANQGKDDEGGLDVVRAIVGSRRHLDAVRFEVPAAGVSALIRRRGSDVNVPSSTAELRRRADVQQVAITIDDDGSWLVIVPVHGEGAAGYVLTTAAPARLRERLTRIAQTRFADPDVALLVLSRQRRVVAAAGAVEVRAGNDAGVLPLWPLLDQAGWEREAALVADHEVDGRSRVAAARMLPAQQWVVTVSRPRAQVYKNLTALSAGFVLAAVGVLLFALIAGALAARAVTKPVLHLAEQARLVGHRQFDRLALDVARGDELGELNRAMVLMAQDLESSEAEALRETRLRGDLSRFLSPRVVDAIIRGEHELTLGGRRAEVSVLFADVVAFTPLAESRQAEQVVTLLNELFAVLSEVVFRHQGIVDKFIGDCVMGVWGAPLEQRDHATRALAAAQDMRRFLESANEDWQERYGAEIRLGIGINSGEAIVGNIGSSKRMEYTVVGDVVNVAARLEAIARPNQILVGARTRELATEAFAFRRLGQQKLTGREAPTEVFELGL